jgi:hypothetical protein
MRKTSHNNKGATLALVAICAGVLILFIVLCFQLMMVFGGLEELNSTADAAALNIAKRSMEIKTLPTGLYADCADSQGQIGLANINRVWGKAYLINANIEEMTANQQATDQASAAGDLSYAGAQTINDNLCAGLKDNLTLGSFFDQIAGLRLHRMLGKTVSADTNTDWSTALAYRGDQSNLNGNINQVPAPANTHFNGISAGNSTYLPGYMPMQTNNKDFYFVAFHSGERPHLITESFFQHNRPEKLAIPSISNPLPNAFSGHGTAQNSMNSHSYAAANPQREYDMAIPHAYVSISLVNQAYWIVQGRQVNMTTYGFAPETQHGAQHIPLGPRDYLEGYASLGNEFGGNASLLSAINSIPGPSVLPRLTQRLQEIQPNFTQNNLEQLLQQQAVLPNVSNYFIYPAYRTPDNTHPSIRIAPLNTQGRRSMPRWLAIGATNEGQAKAVATKAPVQDDPNYDWQIVYGPTFQSGPHWTECSGNIDWTPGTGASQTLGRLTAVHITRCYFTAN